MTWLGKLAKSSITQSIGLKALDNKILRQMQQSQLYSHHAPVTLNIPLVLSTEKSAVQ